MPELKDNDAARKAALADETSRKVLTHMTWHCSPCHDCPLAPSPLRLSPLLSRLSPLLPCRPLALTPFRLAALSLSPFPTLPRASHALPSQALSPEPNPAPCRSLRHSRGLSGIPLYPTLSLPPLLTHQERMEALQAANIAIIDNISASLFQQEEEGVPITSFPGVSEMLGELKERVGVRVWLPCSHKLLTSGTNVRVALLLTKGHFWLPLSGDVCMSRGK